MRLHSLLVCAIAVALLAAPADAGRRRFVHEPAGHQTFTSPQVNPLALSPSGALLLVANTTSNQVDVIATGSNTVTTTIDVGLEPVGIAFRPDGLEAWVTNHVSDSVSVIDTDSGSSTYLEVIATVDELDSSGATLFDEPAGVAFASNTKAYVALSTTNRIAIIDVATRAVSGHLTITAQDPRALTVANGRLYVAAFESDNQSQVSACTFVNGNSIPGHPCSLGLTDLLQFATNPNLPGSTKNIIIDTDQPDRDLFVFDTGSDALIKTVTGVGTLLYGLAVDASDRVYVTQTDARNAVNGDEGQNLIDLDDEMFDNGVAMIDCGGGGSCAAPSIADLDPTPANAALALATPYGVAVSDDGLTVVATAAGTHRVFTMNSTGTILDRLDVGAMPKGVALASGGGGAALTAYVLNTLDNTVAVVDVSSPSAISQTALIPVGNDPTPDAVRRGNIAFNNAFGSNTGNFSCGSCHPDGNTDQLLWRIGGACSSPGCSGDDEPRSTMPIRGLRDTEPLHWDGTLGDPYGGSNGDIGNGSSIAANCDPTVEDGSDESAPAAADGDCMRQLVNAALSGVMCDQAGGCANGPSGKPGLLTDQERQDMAVFLRRVSYPPARGRPIDDDLSVAAEQGFKDFFMDQGGSQGSQPDTCADSDAGCHELPLGTSTNSETLGGFDAPTMRGLNDRWLQFSLGLTHAEPLMALAVTGIDLTLFGLPVIPAVEPEFAWDPADGPREQVTFGTAFLLFDAVYNVRPGNILQMVEEASTGHPGAIGRQVTLNVDTTTGGALAATEALLGELEVADFNGIVNLRGKARRWGGPESTISYLSGAAVYRMGNVQLTHAELVSEASSGITLATLTANLKQGVSEDSPQPLIASRGSNCGDVGTGSTGDPGLPQLSSSQLSIEGKWLSASDRVFVNGVWDTSGSVALTGGALLCSGAGEDSIATANATVTLGVSLGNGMHLLQVQTDQGLLSNELPFCKGNGSQCN